MIISQKVIFTPFSSFSRKRESSLIKQFWAPAFAGATAFLTFYETININELVKNLNPIEFVLSANPGSCPGLMPESSYF